MKLESGPELQSARAVLMVRPANFGFNPQTAASNAFQHAGDAVPVLSVLREFDCVASGLERAGAEVLVAQDTAEPIKPDAIFPNNWISFHADGTVVLYPMLAVNRRAERRQTIIQQVLREGSFEASRTLDLTHHEAQGRYLEGTGSLVLDRAQRTAYACASPRTDLDLLAEFGRLLDYDVVSFQARDGAGQAVYHTNVLMAIGTGFAVVCGESIEPEADRNAVLARLRGTGRDILDLSRPQMQRFAGNLLELATPAGPCIALSSGALDSLKPAQRRALEAHASLLPLSIPAIEHFGGGGVRCMLAEVHLPKRGGGAPHGDARRGVVSGGAVRG
jgi:hypothetical protein